MTDRLAIIHIGIPKTGTTSIQQVLKIKRNELVNQRAAYARSPGSSAHALLTAACAGGPYRKKDWVWDGIAPKLRLEQFHAALAHEMNGLPGDVDRVIFSDERLSAKLQTPEQIGRLRELLQPYFTRFAIIVYLRRQDTLMASNYTQMLRVGMLKDPATVLDELPKLPYFHYDKLLASWAGGFGAAAIQPRLYERDAGGKFDSVDDFLSACGVQLDFPASERARSANPSISTAGQSILRDEGRLLKQRIGAKPAIHEPAWGAITRAVTDVLPGKGWVPTRDEASHFMKLFEDGNEDVRRRYFPDRAHLFSGDFSSLPDATHAPTDRELYEAACKALVESAVVLIKRQRRADWQERLAEKGVLKKPPHLAINDEVEANDAARGLDATQALRTGLGSSRP